VTITQHRAPSRLWLGVWPLAALTLVAATDARAYDPYRQGRDWRADVVQFEARQSRTPVPAGNREYFERDAIALYADARNDIDIGRFASAERRLEMLVGRYPDAAITELARRELKRLYSRAPAGEVPRDERAMAPTPRPSQAPLPPPYGLGRGDITPAAPIVPAREPRIVPPAAASGPLTNVTVPPPKVQAPSALVLAAAEQFRQSAGDRIFFGDGSADIGTRARSALEAQAQWLTRYPQAVIAIESHADDRGTPEFNTGVAERRAEAVRQRLVESGVAPDRIRVSSLGRDQPVVQCGDAACSAQNRRVITAIVGFIAGAERRNGVTVAEPRGDAQPASPSLDSVRLPSTGQPTVQRR
jgi:outer membrane protein OmpA-like peptidoglycan-associated protein